MQCITETLITSDCWGKPWDHGRW